MEKKRRAAYRLINIVAFALLIITIGEAALAPITGSASIFFLIGILKAGLIIYFFMHVYRLWRSEEGH